MVQWTLVCGLATLYASETVKALPIEYDKSETKETLTYMNGNKFPGYGAPVEKTKGESSATGSSSGYTPGAAHPAKLDRRLEGTKTTDMQKLETFFKMELETDITKLSTKCEINPIPWPGSYWPVYADSINYQWSKGNPSPAEKYAEAFGYDADKLMDDISAKRGVDSQSKRQPCETNADCKSLNDKSVCAKRRGKTEGYCVPKWFGICHAWAPAAILEPEPSCKVERNGVVFEPYDIKALITLAYDGSKIPTIFTGSRYNDDAQAINGTDKYGRFLDARRRDISPGFFHLAIANLMCRFNTSFVVDITAGNEVWNQPVRGYEILRLSWMSPAAAAKKYFKVDKYPFNDAATKIAAVTTRFSWVIESGRNGPLVSTGLADNSTKSADYEYILETDSTYQILGGEWVSGSIANHPDFIWLPASKPDNSTITSVGLHYGEIEALVHDSTTNCKDAAETPHMPGSIHPPSTESSTSNSGTTDEANLDVESASGSNPAAELASGSPSNVSLASAPDANTLGGEDSTSTSSSGPKPPDEEEEETLDDSPSSADSTEAPGATPAPEPEAPGAVPATPEAAPATPEAAPTTPEAVPATPEPAV